MVDYLVHWLKCTVLLGEFQIKAVPEGRGFRPNYPAYLISGWTVLKSAGRNIIRGQVFDENFLMTIATTGAIAIHKLPEAAGVMLFYKIGELFQEGALTYSPALKGRGFLKTQPKSSS